jgi:hypothetical protein
MHETGHTYHVGDFERFVEGAVKIGSCIYIIALKRVALYI